MSAAQSAAVGAERQRGSVTVELALVVPAMVIILGLMIAGGRLWFARATVQEAADAAARAGSLARTAEQARSDGRAAAQRSLGTGGLVCRDQSAEVDSSGFAVAVGNPATVTVTVSCRVPFADVVLPGMPGSIALTTTGTSALDTYRSRG